MRLHSLTLQAIGPYAGEHSIDFVELGRAGLFLLEGPTGAGKSTIIDAIVFGLYGELAGTGASKDRLHSHHAAPGVVPFVELVFETGSGVYRVRRTPAHRRPKQRGGGFTDQPAGATLMRLTDPDAEAGETLSTRTQEIGPEITRIVGLTRAQFVQTIVLPQGEFAKFLSADGEDRSALLRSLFGTEHYERLAEHLVALRQDARREVAAAERTLGEAVARFSGAAQLAEVRARVEAAAAGVVAAAEGDGAAALEEGPSDANSDAGVDEPEDADADAAATASVEAVERAREDDILASRLEPDSLTLQPDVGAIVHVLRSRSDRAAAVAAAAATELDDARAARDAAVRLQQRLERRIALLAKQEQLAVDDDWITQLTAQVAAAQRADTVTTAVSGAQSATIGLERAETALVAARADAGPETAALALEELVERREAITAERAGLAARITLERSLAGREAEIASLGRRIDDTERRLAGLSADDAAREAQRIELGTGTTTVEERRDEVAAARIAAENVRARIAVLDRIDTLDERRAAATDALGEAISRARAAVDAEAALRRRRIDGMAGELASALQDDDPCPVCGSASHPAPAALSGEHPSEHSIEEAASAREAAEERVRSARGTHEAILAERAVLVGELLAAGGLDAAQAAEAAGTTEAEAAGAIAIDVTALRDDATDAAEQAITRLSETADALAVAEAHAETLRTIEAATTAAAAERAELTPTLATLTERRKGEREAVAAARADIAAVLGELGDTLEELDNRLAQERERIVALAAAHAAVADRIARRTERQAELASALEAAGFTDLEAAEAAVLESGDRARHEAAIAEHHRQTQQVTDGLVSPEISELSGHEVVDIDAAEQQLSGVRETARIAADEAAVAARRADQAEAAQSELDDAVAENAEAVREAAEVIRLADVVSATGADNVKRITLGTYVLLRRFEDVVAAANARLEAMSGGRYELVRSDVKEGASRAQRIGLSLTVHDHRTDTRRDPKSLSGGETFYASLCLALGLADVVTGEAGGVELGTLFVDEGFGSLDPETLDTVMAELGRLSAGGRVVGVVSHVEEMKQRIGERIEVRRLADGSSTLLVRA